MANDAIDRHTPGEIQNIDKIVPAGIQENRILIRFELVRVDTEKLVSDADFKIAVSKGRDAGLNPDFPIVRGKRLLSKGEVKIIGPDGKPFQNGFLSLEVRGIEEQYHEADQKCRSTHVDGRWSACSDHGIAAILASQQVELQ
jgi:hypothetical protein